MRYTVQVQTMLFHHSGKKVNKELATFGIEPVALVPPLFAGLLFFVIFTDGAMAAAIGTVFLSLLPLYLPFLLFVYFWMTWIHYVRLKFWSSLDFVLLEIQIPAEMQKSPLAMEVFLTALWNAGGETTFINRMWNGRFRAVWSLEIASNEGRVSFYIHMRRAFKNMTEARLYGQFPEVQVREVPDYTQEIDFNNKEYGLFGGEYDLNKPAAYPIKTYIDFGLDKDPKEEFRIDPIAHFIETLGSIGPGEHFWFQIILVARKKDQWFGFYKKEGEFEHEVKSTINEIMHKSALRAKKIIEGSDITEGKMTLLTDGEKRAIEAIERKAAKLLFECGFRTVYVAKKDKFNGVNAGAIIRFFDQYRSNEFNSLGAARGTTYFDYPWQDFMDIRQNNARNELFDYYSKRAYFYAPYDQVPQVLSIEEVATLWHFPGSTVQSPSLARKLSRTGEAPINLPT